MKLFGWLKKKKKLPAAPACIVREELEIVKLQSESYIDHDDLGYFSEETMKSLLAVNLGHQMLPYISYRTEEQGSRTRIRASVSVIMRTEDDKRDD